MKQYKGKVLIAGKEYNCEVIDGVRYINGVTVSEFAKQLSPAEIFELANVGGAALDAERENRKFSPSMMYTEVGSSKK